MMHLRRWISVVAVVGMLAHTVALVRHDAAMLSALLQLPRLTADLARICHGGEAMGRSVGDAENPYDAQANCPICSGLGPLVFVLPVVRVPLRADLAAQRATLFPSQPVSVVGLALRPPVRGPPLPA
jgi:hypothetical protein